MLASVSSALLVFTSHTYDYPVMLRNLLSPLPATRNELLVPPWFYCNCKEKYSMGLGSFFPFFSPFVGWLHALQGATNMQQIIFSLFDDGITNCSFLVANMSLNLVTCR